MRLDVLERFPVWSPDLANELREALQLLLYFRHEAQTKLDFSLVFQYTPA